MLIKKKGVILKSRHYDFEKEGVLNPAVIAEKGSTHLFYRSVGENNYSTIGHCLLDEDGEVISRKNGPLIVPEHDYESQGVEDPRIVKIDDLFYLTYSAYDGVNASGALAISKDLSHFEKKGIIVPCMSYARFAELTANIEEMGEKYRRFNCHESIDIKDGKQLLVWDKNLVFFPRRINGKLTFLHRIRPDIQLCMVDELSDLSHEFWEKYIMKLDKHVVLKPLHDHESSYIGAGCPPIETDKGWLLIYHGVKDSIDGYVYSACAALLDLHNPLKEIARLPLPLFTPEEPWELNGMVNNVCFPSGTTLHNGVLSIFYGAADERIALAKVRINELLDELLKHKP